MSLGLYYSEEANALVVIVTTSTEPILGLTYIGEF